MPAAQRFPGLVLEPIREAVDEEPHVEVPVRPEAVFDDVPCDLQARLRPEALASVPCFGISGARLIEIDRY